MFGDTSPEDAWHPDDPTAVLLGNLERRALDLGRVLPALDRLERVGRLVRELGQYPHRETDRVRLAMLAEDVHYVAARLEEYRGGE